MTKLPSGRYRASYLHEMTVWTPTPRGTTFGSKLDAEGWLADERRRIDRGTWTPPGTEIERGRTLADYAEHRIAQRTLTPRTRKGYTETLENHIAPVLGEVPLSQLSVTLVRAWYSTLLLDKPTARAHAYSLLHSICRDAVSEKLIDANPCVERKAMNAKRTRKIRTLTVAQLTEVAEHTEPKELVAAVLIAGWCGLRSGELKGLQRNDIAEDASVVSVRRAVTYRSGEYFEGAPKTEDGVRDVSVPKRIRPAILAHLDKHTGKGAQSLVFAGNGGPEGYLTDWQLRRAVATAGRAAGIDNLRPHELRHTAATLAAQTGATTKELMARIGHSTADAALIYQHAAAERDAAIARKLDEM
ncbi:site-specific integrase [Rhodococcus sp. 14-2470-1b]|uniref:tyrosine-type recombinase/integrase n=1 Tax=Rhodococcus sp. 14-2470-1b TaxID=2023149 RepID=UPI0015952914|nr:site-specific integrase [Rhodococcus sp. 14-2470-1b]